LEICKTWAFLAENCGSGLIPAKAAGTYPAVGYCKRIIQMGYGDIFIRYSTVEDDKK